MESLQDEKKLKLLNAFNELCNKENFLIVEMAFNILIVACEEKKTTNIKASCESYKMEFTIKKNDIKRH